MPTLPWSSTGDPQQGDVLVMATRLNLTSLRSVPGFLRASMAIRKQVMASAGAHGVSIVAHPLRRNFLTLSAWTDRAALDRFVGAEPHRGAMRRYRPVMDHPVFVTWTVPAAQLPPSWSDAHQHLDRDSAREV